MNCFIKKLFILTQSLTVLGLLSSCVTDPGVASKRGLVKDFSITNPTTGCEAGYLDYDATIKQLTANPSTAAISCVVDCGTSSGYHKATDAELADIEKKGNTIINDNIKGSAGVCLLDAVADARPTNAIDIKSDFCACINGKSDIINDCSAFCATVPVTSIPTLYLNTIIGPEIALNTKMGNLYNWCNVQLESDPFKPQCFLSVTDGVTTIDNISPNISPGSNSLTAPLTQLALDKTYIVKIVEGKSGSNAQSKEFQIRRRTQPTEDTTIQGVLKVTPINQYTCLSFGGALVANQMIRTTYARVFYYFASNETPPPIPPAGGSTLSSVVCHDEQLHPGNDSAEYPRLELLPQHFAMWEKTDPRFVNQDGTGLVINKTLMTRLYTEYGVSATMDLFKLINYPNRPTSASTSTANVALGYMMVPFTDKGGKTFCPTQTDFNSNDPLFSLLKEYMDSTEGLYLAEKEAETILDNGVYKTVYGTMFITESVIKKYGFYIENGLKIKATQASMNTKTIYYYWPVSQTADPLAQGNRKLFTVRSPDTLNGAVPTGTSTTQRSTDKRIGCVPASL